MNDCHLMLPLSDMGRVEPYVTTKEHRLPIAFSTKKLDWIWEDRFCHSSYSVQFILRDIIFIKTGVRYDIHTCAKSVLESIEQLRTKGIDGYRLCGAKKVTSVFDAKVAMMQHGPLILVMEVKSNDTDFWKGDESFGFHAVMIVGWNEQGFILRNTWGWEYGEAGYATLPFDFFYTSKECWVIL